MINKLFAVFLIIILMIIFIFSQVDIIRYLNLTKSTIQDLIKLDQKYWLKPRVSTNHRVVISLTTIPIRINDIYYTINSLLDQSHRVDQINICIPYYMKRTGLPYIVPDYLKNLQNVKIINCQDFGPITKLLPTLNLENNPDTKIIYIDDDRIYSYTSIETLVKYSEKFENFAICNWGWKIPSDRNFLTHSSFRNLAPKYLFSYGSVDIIEGCEGCLVKPKFFTPDIYSLDHAPRELFFVDDICISGHLAKNNIPRYRIPHKLSRYAFAKLPRPSHDTPLSTVNNNGHNNNTAIKYFNDYW